MEEIKNLKNIGRKIRPKESQQKLGELIRPKEKDMKGEQHDFEGVVLT